MAKKLIKSGKPVRRVNQNPSRFRQFILWFKPSFRMSFDQYVDHYFRLSPKVRQKLRELSGNEKIAEKRFRYMVRHYSKIYGPEDNILDHNALKEGLTGLKLPRNAIVASFGAGDMHHEGFLVKEFPQIASIIGVEPLKEMRDRALRTTRNILGLRNKQIKNTEGTFESAPSIPAGSVDAIITNEAFHHSADAEKALQHMASKIKPGGGIVIVYRPNYPSNPISPQEIQSTLRKLGFKTIINRATRMDSNEPNNNIQLIVAVHQP